MNRRDELIVINVSEKDEREFVTITKAVAICSAIVVVLATLWVIWVVTP